MYGFEKSVVGVVDDGLVVATLGVVVDGVKLVAGVFWGEVVMLQEVNKLVKANRTNNFIHFIFTSFSTSKTYQHLYIPRICR